MIQGNSGLQEGFGQLEVVFSQSRDQKPQIDGQAHSNQTSSRINVLQALLSLALFSSSIESFDVRLAASECIKAYLYGHAQIRSFFLRRAITGHLSDYHEADNILTILIEQPDSIAADPYRRWIASVLLLHLLYEDPDTKSAAISVKDGNAEMGEEVVTCIQAITSNLIAAERKGEDERVSIGYLMVLCGWLYEDHDAVNDFLAEGSNVQSIVQLVVQDKNSRILASGLCTFLLGIAYEFSTKDSPLPRELLYQLLTTGLGRENYLERITRLREHRAVRDFEVLPQCLTRNTSNDQPEVYFDRTFVDFLKDNFSRILRAIDRAPGIEVPVIANGVHKGISRELVDSLKVQLEARAQVIQELESETVTLDRKLSQEQADHRKAKESASLELSRIKSINDGLQKNHEDDLQRISNENRAAQTESKKAHEAVVSSLRAEIQKIREDSEATISRIQTRTNAEIDELKSTIRTLKFDLDKLNKDHVQDLQTAHEDYTAKLIKLESRLRWAEEKATDAENGASHARAEVGRAEELRKNAQTELDDLLIVLEDLEEKRMKDKVRNFNSFRKWAFN